MALRRILGFFIPGWGLSLLTKKLNVRKGDIMSREEETKERQSRFHFHTVTGAVELADDLKEETRAVLERNSRRLIRGAKTSGHDKALGYW